MQAVASRILQFNLCLIVAPLHFYHRKATIVHYLPLLWVNRKTFTFKLCYHHTCVILSCYCVDRSLTSLDSKSSSKMVAENITFYRFSHGQLLDKTLTFGQKRWLTVIAIVSHCTTYAKVDYEYGRYELCNSGLQFRISTSVTQVTDFQSFNSSCRSKLILALIVIKS